MGYEVFVGVDVDVCDDGEIFFLAINRLGNYTFNIAPILRLALGEAFGDLSGRKCMECVQLLEKAILDIRSNANPEYGKYAKFSERIVGLENSYIVAQDVLSELLRACKRYPKAIVKIYR